MTQYVNINLDMLAGDGEVKACRNGGKTLFLLDVPDNIVKYSSERYEFLKGIVPKVKICPAIMVCFEKLDINKILKYEFPWEEIIQKIKPMVELTEFEYETLKEVGEYKLKIVRPIRDIEYKFNNLNVECPDSLREKELSCELDISRLFQIIKIKGGYEKPDLDSVEKLFSWQNGYFNENLKNAEEYGIRISKIDKIVLEASKLYDELYNYYVKLGFMGWVNRESGEVVSKLKNNSELKDLSEKMRGFFSLKEELNALAPAEDLKSLSERYWEIERMRKKYGKPRGKLFVGSTLTEEVDFYESVRIAAFASFAYLYINHQKEKDRASPKISAEEAARRVLKFAIHSNYFTIAFIDPADYINIKKLTEKNVCHIKKYRAENAVDELRNQMEKYDSSPGILIVKTSEIPKIVEDLEKTNISYVQFHPK